MSRTAILRSGLPIGILVIGAMISACTSTRINDFAAVDQLEDMVLVIIEDPRSERRRRGIAGPGYNNRINYPDDPVLHRHVAVIAKDHDLSVMTEWPLRGIGVHCFFIKRPSMTVMIALQQDTRVLWVQEINRFELLTVAQSSLDSASFASEFLSDFAERGRNVEIVVVDTAVDRQHPDLRKSEINYTNFAGNRGQPALESHGTAVVGLIAAKSSSPNGVNALARDAVVHVLRACWQADAGPGECNTFTLSLALDAAIGLKPDILNLSITGNRDRLLETLITELIANDTLVIAAYDENRSSKSRFPMLQSGVAYAYGIESGAKLPEGKQVLAAPRHALSLAPMAGYDVFSGHSFAAPQLSAMAACLINRHPEANPDQIVGYLGNWLERHYRKTSSEN